MKCGSIKLLFSRFSEELNLFLHADVLSCSVRQPYWGRAEQARIRQKSIWQFYFQMASLACYSVNHICKVTSLVIFIDTANYCSRVGVNSLGESESSLSKWLCHGKSTCVHKLNCMKPQTASAIEGPECSQFLAILLLCGGFFYEYQLSAGIHVFQSNCGVIS